MEKLKIAIIGAGIAGLACALECERLGVTAEVFERQHSFGWMWPSITSWPIILSNNNSDPIKYLKDTYNINIKAALEEKIIIIKSPNSEARIEGKLLGYSLYRGKEVDSIENQLSRELRKTAIHYNTLTNYKELSQKYDYVVVATGRDMEAKELGVWEEQGRISMMGAITLGSFEQDTSLIYFDTEYAGTGFARISPYSSSEAILALYVIYKGDFNTLQLDINRYFEKFLEKEKLDKLEIMNRIMKPPFSTGKVNRFKIGNILLAGRAAGLTDRLIGTGGIEAIISGVLAARAMIRDEDYDKMLKPVQKHIENISSFRKQIDEFDNNDFDKLVSFLGTPGIKQMLYNTGIDFVDMVGSILKKFKG